MWELGRRIIYYHCHYTRVAWWCEGELQGWSKDLKLIQHVQEGNRPYLNYSFTNSNLRYKNRIYMDKNQYMWRKLIKNVYNDPIGGHSRILGTYKQVRSLFYWRHLYKDVKALVHVVILVREIRLKKLIIQAFFNHCQFSKAANKIYLWIS